MQTSDTLRSPIEALASELGATVARIEKALQQKFDLLAAELRAECSDLRAKAIEWELRAVNAERASAEKVSDRLATVKDGEPGRSVTVEDVAPIIRAEVERVVSVAVAAIPPAPAGKDVDPEAVRAMVTEAVAALPPAEKGKDADPSVIAAMVREEVAKLPAPEPGRNADIEDVRPLVVALVTEAVAAIPPAEPGKDADPEVIRQMVAEEVSRLPPAQAGKDADPEVIRAMVTEIVTAAVSALPAPAKGDPGPPGRLAAVKDWTDGVHYDGDIVTLGGSTFQAIRDTGRQPPHDDWVCIASAGRNGADGRSFAIRGTWEPDGEYRELDVVAMNGASFVAKSDDPGPCPGDGWQLMSAQGKRGKPGDPGNKGDPGPKGPAVIALGIDDNGIQTLRNADGTTVSCDFYPILSRLDR